MVVRFLDCTRRSRAACTTASLSESKALVAANRSAQARASPRLCVVPCSRCASEGSRRQDRVVPSSNSRMGGLRMIARAMAMRCFCTRQTETKQKSLMSGVLPDHHSVAGVFALPGRPTSVEWYSGNSRAEVSQLKDGKKTRLQQLQTCLYTHLPAERLVAIYKHGQV